MEFLGKVVDCVHTDFSKSHTHARSTTPWTDHPRAVIYRNKKSLFGSGMQKARESADGCVLKCVVKVVILGTGTLKSPSSPSRNEKVPCFFVTRVTNSLAPFWVIKICFLAPFYGCGSEKLSVRNSLQDYSRNSSHEQRQKKINLKVLCQISFLDYIEKLAIHDC